MVAIPNPEILRIFNGVNTASSRIRHMQISIIIPVLNEAERIGSLVRYLRTNGGAAVLEMLVVDAGSRDATERLAIEAGARVIHSSVQSRAAQMNAGAREAKGDLLYFVHADTLPPPSFVSDMEDALRKGYVMGCFAYRFDSSHFWLRINAYFNRFNFLWCQGGDKTFFIKPALFRELGGYNEHFVIMEEYDFLRRAMPRYPLVTIRKYALVSARKYQKNGWLRVQIANIIAFNLFQFGVAPQRLKRFYKSMIR